ncbi:MAG: hypothetical protein ACI311_04415 [Bacilli bacterium]
MNNKNDEKYKILNIEVFMFLLFILASCVDLFNLGKTKVLYDLDQPLNEEIRQKYIVANVLILIVFTVFMIRNYNNLKNLSKDSEEYEIAMRRLIGSILIVLGEVMVLNYFYKSTVFNNNM